MPEFDFSTLITDRSRADLQVLRDVLSTPMEDWTAEQLAAFNQAASKGAYNYTDLNRVTACMEYLNEQLTAQGYVTGYVPVVVHPAEPPAGRLPEGYTELEYIESSGTQWINSAVKADPTGLRVVIDFAYTSAHDTTSLFGSSIGSNWSIVPYGNPIFYVGTSGGILPLSTALNTRYVMDVSAQNGTLTVSLNGAIQSAAYTGTLESTTDIYVFAHNVQGAIQQLSNYRLFSMDMYISGAKVRSFVPCLSPSGDIGLYDIIGEQYYGNSGSGAFIAGPEVTQPEPEPGPESYTWYEDDIPTAELMAGYLANAAAIWSALLDNPPLPETMAELTPERANQIEAALLTVKAFIQRMALSFFYSDEIYCGEV